MVHSPCEPLAGGQDPVHSKEKRLWLGVGLCKMQPKTQDRKGQIKQEHQEGNRNAQCAHGRIRQAGDSLTVSRKSAECWRLSYKMANGEERHALTR